MYCENLLCFSIKKTQTISFLFFFFSFSLFSQSDYRIQLTTFSEEVPLDYFKGIGNVQMLVDHNELFRYYVRGSFSKAEAEKKAAELKTKGFQYVTILDMDDVKNKCSACNPSQSLFLESIFFDFDKATLRAKSIEQLNTMAKILKENPSYKAKLTGHTDAKGSNEYNQNLSQRRADSAKNHLLSLGIAASRISIDFNGEINPIAKNERPGGIDNPTGRQYNRRVILSVLNSTGKEVDIVKEIDVPSDLVN